MAYESNSCDGEKAASQGDLASSTLPICPVRQRQRGHMEVPLIGWHRVLRVSDVQGIDTRTALDANQSFIIFVERE